MLKAYWSFHLWRERTVSLGAIAIAFEQCEASLGDVCRGVPMWWMRFGELFCMREVVASIFGEALANHLSNMVKIIVPVGEWRPQTRCAVGSSQAREPDTQQPPSSLQDVKVGR